jgi:hypothetical protein
MKHTTQSAAVPELLQELFRLLEAHRAAFGQARPYWRAMALVLGELFSFARHTVTQALMALGLTDADWSGWYRLFSRKRFDEATLAECLLRETLVHVPAEQVYVVGVDGIQVPRSSLKMPGTSWLKAPRTPAFRVGIHRAQRFVHGAWLTPLQAGYSQAIPLRWLPAFPPKAVAAGVPARREWEAGLSVLGWMRGGLDRAGRAGQWLLALTDGSYDTLEMWRGLPERVALATRCARHRCLYQLPAAYPGRGRPASYGARAPKPYEWLHERVGWQQQQIMVRGRAIGLRYRLEGAFVREGLPERPVWLIVVRGVSRWVGKARTRRYQRPPAFYLVSALPSEQGWQLPLPVEELLAWLWQRWEMEVAHREMKSGLGVGEKQCWSQRGAVVSVQWSVWVYAILVLAGVRAWGLQGGPPVPTRWWPGAGRWSFNTLWRAYRAALWQPHQFQALWTTTGDNWLKKEAWLVGMANAVAGAARI